MYRYLFLVFSLILSCCTTISPTQHRNEAIQSALKQNFNAAKIQTKTFLLTTYQRLSTQPQTIHVYIEGDGHSWKTRYQVSDNPTPHQPLALVLATRDPHPDVVYVARPCQYTPLEQDKLCVPKFWTSHRYAPEVIQANLEVLDALQQRYPNVRFKLVGFSGGASVATIVAAQRKDVLALVTVAGDLNHERLNQHHKTTPLKGSLNPIMYVDKLKNMPQLHLSGDKDKIVPTWMAKEFAERINNPQKVQVKVFKSVGHHAGWEERWVEICKTF